MARAVVTAVIVEVDAVAAAAVANRDTEQYHRVSREKEEILYLLRKRGFRVTKQRELILDIVFEHECASCKEIYYQAIQRDPGIGMGNGIPYGQYTDGYRGVKGGNTETPDRFRFREADARFSLKNQNKIVLIRRNGQKYFKMYCAVKVIITMRLMKLLK